MIRTFLGRCLASLIVCQLLIGGIALAGPQEDVAAASTKWAAALAENDPDKVLSLYAQDAVLWGTLSPTVRSNPASLRDYFVNAFKSASWAESCIWGAVDQNLRQHCGQYRVLHLFLRERWRSQDLACPIQFHLRQHGEKLDDRGSPFVGHASAPKVISRSVMKRLTGLRYRRAMVPGCDAANHSFMQAARSDW